METYAFGGAKLYVGNVQMLVYSPLGLMPSLYQKASLEAQLGLYSGSARASPASTHST